MSITESPWVVQEFKKLPTLVQIAGAIGSVVVFVRYIWKLILFWWDYPIRKWVKSRNRELLLSDPHTYWIDTEDRMANHFKRAKDLVHGTLRRLEGDGLVHEFKPESWRSGPREKQRYDGRRRG